MALQRKRVSEIPADAVMLDERQALEYQTNILYNWTPQSDIFGYKYGSTFLGAATIATGWYLNNFFRMKFKLLHYGSATSYLPMCLVPSAIAVMFHHQFVLKNVTLMNPDQCAVCLQTRAAAIQAGFGCVLPVVLAPVTSLTLVHRFHTYNIPYISKEPMKVFRDLQSKFARIKNKVFWIFLCHAMLGNLITYWETRSVLNVHLKLHEMEKQVEEQL